jgi:peroxiredoxin
MGAPAISLVVTASLALMVLGDVCQPGSAGAADAGEPVGRVAEGKGAAHEGRGLSVEAAMRELDLIRPPRARPAPDFSLGVVGGGRFRLADHRGKIVLVNFWATWCPPCLEEMPALERLWQRHRHQGFVLVAVALDASVDLVPAFVSEHKLTFPVALDPKLEVGNAYAVRALPTTVIVGKDGGVRALALGPRVWDNVAAHALVRGLVR